MLIHEMLKNIPKDNTALIYEDKEISYSQVEKTVTSFSAFLQNKGIMENERILLISQNSPEFIYSYFALSTIGAKIIPLNLLLTLEEILYVINDSGASGIIIHEKILQKLKNAAQIPLKKIIVINSDLFYNLHEDKPKVTSSAKDTDLCTILYTSGTTGKPKGAMLSHRNLISNIISVKKAIEITEKDNFICVLPMFHSFAFTVCVLTPLYSGGKITIQETFQPKETLSLIVSKQVNVFCGVPSMYNFVTQAADRNVLGYIRIAVSGGAPLAIEVLEAFERKFEKPLVEGYGLTEASPVVSFNPLHRERKKGSIGVPIPDVEVKIVDENDQELPVGEVGELIVRGKNVMMGYLNLPEETAVTLRNGWLHTGDIGYKDDEGYIYIVDRKKDMVIVGGLNVYPREIEEEIYKYPGISECAVIGIPDKSRGELLIAYVVIKEGFSFDKKALLKYLKERLAIYKLPKVVEVISSIPKTGPGKIDKKQLRKMAMEG